MNPDLLKERKSGSFDPEQLTYILDGGKDKTIRRRHFVRLVSNNPAFDGPADGYMSRKELFEEALRKHVTLVKIFQELGVDDLEARATMSMTVLNEGIGPLELHFLAFLNSLKMLADDEQKRKWLSKAERCEIIGCYAQTELGHGSFVQGIETRADYDVKSEEFVLNTPTLTATKWWVGTMGVSATHALVMAQLYTKGKCEGVNLFLVQIRDPKTLNALPGVTVGDIGPKLGLNSIANGFLRLNNVRIPRDQLLGKTGRVLPDGTYIKPQNAKLVYGSMLGIRAILPATGAYNLARAVTIAVRYSCVRHQSELKLGQGEPQVLDYQTQQHKLFPLLAAAYAFSFVGEWLYNFHQGVFSEINNGNFKRLAEDHVLAAGLKAVVCWKAHEGIEVCRLSCGGHGYSLASGLPKLYSNHVANSTAEGETVVLLLQTAGYIMKCLMELKNDIALDPSVTYLGQAFPSYVSLTDEIDINSLLGVVQFRSKKCAEYASQLLQKDFMESGNQKKAFNNNKVVLVECAKAHIEAVIMASFVSKVKEILQNQPQIGKVMKILCQIYGVTEILAHGGDYIEHEYLKKSDLDHLQDQLFTMYDYIRPEAVLLVDSFDFKDSQLRSILGQYDGQVYDNMFKWARLSPLNKQDHETYHKYIQQLKLAKL